MTDCLFTPVISSPASSDPSRAAGVLSKIWTTYLQRFLIGFARIRGKKSEANYCIFVHLKRSSIVENGLEPVKMNLLDINCITLLQIYALCPHFATTITMQTSCVQHQQEIHD